MKRWKITMKLEELTLYAYVEAAIVLKTSHDRVQADGVTIDLPGDIVTVEMEIA